MQISLTKLQSYNIINRLLENYYKQTNSDDIGSLLSVMQFLPDNMTADPAIWEDWIDSIENKSILTKQEAFNGMIKFLEIYYGFTSSADAKLLIDEMHSAKSCDDMDVSIVKQWNVFLKEILSEPEDSRQYLNLIKE